MKIPKDMLIGAEFETRTSGIAKIIKYEDSKNVTVKFIATGYIAKTRSSHLRDGNLKDPYFPVIHGVGFYGEGRHQATKQKKPLPVYDCWRNMLARCYCDKIQEKRPTYKGCSVSPEWHNFQVFAEWYYLNHPNDGDVHHLDKDIKINGNKVYSPETCIFANLQENNEKAQAKNYSIKSPTGEVFSVYNLSKFCRENGLEVRDLNAVVHGHRPHHKGWTKP